MKNFIFFLLVMQHGVLSAAQKAVILSIPGMDCPVCKITIKKSLQKEVGVTAVDVNYENKTVGVTFDDQLTTIPNLLKATENVGYPSVLQGHKK